jgi:uncharacterized protein YqhQ
MKNKSFLFYPALLPLLCLRAMGKPTKVGGQAIIEGVMMRGKQRVSWAVRKPDGTVVVEKSTFISARTKIPLLRFPVLRGAVNLYESLVLGYKALSRSAEIATEEETKTSVAKAAKRKSSNAAASIASFGFALVVSFGLFMYLPMWILSQFVPADSAILFNTGAGIIRIVLFLAYLIAISMWKDMQRVFEYHGAEHKAIFTYEDGKELTLENMRPYTTLHPRCGTSFLLLVGLVCILLFSLVDALVISFVGPYPHVAARFGVHLLLVPLVAGTSFEALKMSDRYRHLPLVGALILPGLWLQKITTRKPDDQQLEVASTALKAVL